MKSRNRTTPWQTALRLAALHFLSVATVSGAPAPTPSENGAGLGFDPDTISLRWEVGATSDVTNELFYEDSFVDTTFLGRRTVSSPEARIAGVVLASLQGTRGAGSTQFVLQNELRLGAKLQRNVTGFRWNTDFSPQWRFQFNPGIEFKQDKTFGRDLTEARGEATAGIRRRFDDGATYADWRLAAEFLRTNGEDADFLPDRNEFRTGLAVDRLAVFGHEWRLDYRFAARQFPDSMVRDHFEQGVDGRWKYNLRRGHFIAFDASGTRRVTMREAPTSRDNFWEEWLRSELLLRLNEEWAWRTRGEVEGVQYDVQDTTLYFDYYVARAETGPRFDRAIPVAIGVGPTVEVLDSALNPAEAYLQYGAFLEAEFLGGSGWWSVLPTIGWREYRQETGAQDPLAVHTSYTFYELGLYGDQRVPGNLRLRTVATFRRELHDQDVDNATSLYFSVDVRRIF
jgi:hypothetical protein